MVKKVSVIVQSRATSSRLPNKCFKKIGRENIISIIIKRLEISKKINEIIFAVPKGKKNKKLSNYLKKINILTFEGDERNVLKRYFDAAKKFNCETIVRITADNPLIDPFILDEMINIFHKQNYDYLSNINPPSFPDGLDIEIFSFQALKKTFLEANNDYDKEHVTSYIRKNKNFKKKNFSYFKDLSNYKLSVDTAEDLIFVRKVFKIFNNNFSVSFKKIVKNKNFLELLKKNQKKRSLKQKFYLGQKKWQLAKKIISGGNMLLSKNPESFIPDLWPTYYKKAKGCTVEDLDGNKLIDFSTMSVGTNVLGYRNNVVDNSVKRVIDQSNMATLNCPEEVDLAKKLLKIHPYFHKVKFARTGGEANAIAIRIARAFTNKDNVAICGYHGWHDWYLSANLNNQGSKNLSNHLIEGLEVSGVPKKLKNTVYPFEYGNYEQVNKLLKEKNIGIIKMEVCRNTKPDIKFLKYIRKICNKKKIILIFDECTTGFRESFGGLHKKIKVFPDMVIFGKALGNGYPITAILGKENIMGSISKTFVSSTFWTERIGYVAALKTLEFMKKKRTWLLIKKIGLKIQSEWKRIFKKYNLDVEIFGIPSLSRFIFKKNHLEYKTLLTQEMLRRDFLASNIFYPSICHNENLQKKYLKAFEDSIKIIKTHENSKKINKIIQSKSSRDGFRRFN